MPLNRPFPFLLAGLLAGSLAACNPSASEEPPLRVETVAFGARQALIADSTGRGLTARDSEGRVVPGLAQSWRVSDDGLSIVFRLREAQFADGRRVLASDVVSSINRARGVRGPDLVRAMLAGVSAASSPLDGVIELRLATPQPELLELLATAALAIRQGNAARSSAGPYRVEPQPAPAAAKPAAAGPPPLVTLMRSDTYFAAADVAIARVALSRATPEEAIARFNRGEIDIVTGGTLEGIGAARVLGRRDALKLEQQRGVILLLINQKSGPLKDLRVRTALSMAVDRGAIGPAAFGSAAAAAVPGLTPLSLKGYTQGPVPDWAAWPLVQRLEEARRLLLEAGHDPLDKRLKVQIAIPDSPEAQRLVDGFADEWAAIGVDILLARRTPEFHAEAVQKADFEIALATRIAPVDSPLPFLQPFTCAANRHGACLPEADALLAASWKAPTLADRMAALAAAERLWTADSVAIALVQPVGWSLVSPQIAGWTPNPSGVHPLHPLLRLPDRKLIR